jgi:hypothetical protein
MSQPHSVYRARGVPPPPTHNGVTTLTIQAGEDKRRGQVSTPWQPIECGAFQLVTIFQCDCCRRTYGDARAAERCRAEVCSEGRL